MKNTPLKYRLNVIGGGLIIFIVIRTYLPMAAASVGLRDNFNIWLLVYMATLALACLLPVAFIENMCDFHPVLLKKPQLTATDGLLVMSSMFLFIHKRIPSESKYLSSRLLQGKQFPKL